MISGRKYMSEVSGREGVQRQTARGREDGLEISQ